MYPYVRFLIALERTWNSGPRFGPNFNQELDQARRSVHLDDWRNWNSVQHQF